MEDEMGKRGTGWAKVGGRAGSYGCKVTPSSEGTGETVHRGLWICAGEEEVGMEIERKEDKVSGNFEM